MLPLFYSVEAMGCELFDFTISLSLSDCMFFGQTIIFVSYIHDRACQFLTDAGYELSTVERLFTKVFVNPL